MRFQPAGVDARVRQLPATFRYAVALEFRGLTLEMSAAEALRLADQLVDAAEQRSTQASGGGASG